MREVVSQLTQLRVNGVICAAKLWVIELKSGTVLRFTGHHDEIAFDGNTYTPVSVAISDHESRQATSSTAIERSSQFGEATVDLSGAITTLTSDSINHDDLAAGLYDNAKITVYTVDFRFPWLGAYTTDVFWITAISYDEDTFRAELSSVMSWIQNREGNELTRHCPYRLGDNDGSIGCLFSIPQDVVTVTVVGNNYTVFTCTNASATRPDRWSEYGLVKWQTGSNANTEQEVKLDDQDSGSTHTITLQERTPFPIQVGDTAILEAGCDKRIGTCDDKFSQLINFGGCPDIPGDDAQFSTPNAQ